MKFIQNMWMVFHLEPDWSERSFQRTFESLFKMATMNDQVCKQFGSEVVVRLLFLQKSFNFNTNWFDCMDSKLSIRYQTELMFTWSSTGDGERNGTLSTVGFDDDRWSFARISYLHWDRSLLFDTMIPFLLIYFECFWHSHLKNA